jgi:predicted RNase H-like nuclease (RuvC/YqgF family)
MIKQWIFDTFFAKEKELIETLVADNEELKGICVEQIQQIQDLETKNYKLDFENEDLELKIERLEDRIEDLEYDNDQLHAEHGQLESERDYLQDQVYDLQYQLQNKEEF